MILPKGEGKALADCTRRSMSSNEKSNQNKAPSQTSTLALASMVVGVLGIPLLGSLIGHLALSRINRSGGALKGEKFSRTGIFLGYLNVFLIAILVLIVRYLYEMWKNLSW